MLKVFIRDRNRTSTLQTSLINLGVDASEWLGDEVVRPDREELLFLIHSSELSTGRRKKLQVAAKQGATVVFYTAGVVEEGDHAVGAGRVLDMGWDNLLQVLDQLPEGFDLETFARFAEAVRNRNVFTALAILSWCATFPSNDYEVKQRQQAWRKTNTKWLLVFEGINRDDLFKAAGVDPKQRFPQKLAEVERFVNWLRPPEGDRNELPSPNFRELLKELQAQFGMQA